MRKRRIDERRLLNYLRYGVYATDDEILHAIWWLVVVGLLLVIAGVAGGGL